MRYDVVCACERKREACFLMHRKYGVFCKGESTAGKKWDSRIVAFPMRGRCPAGAIGQTGYEREMEV